MSVEARAARQQRVLADAQNQVKGTSHRTPLNPVWDQSFLVRLRADGRDAICAMSEASVTRDGGCGGHVIRTWIAPTAAPRVAGVHEFDLRYYRALPDWVAGYAVVTAA